MSSYLAESGAPVAEDVFEFRQDLCVRKLECIGSWPAFFACLTVSCFDRTPTCDEQTDRVTDRPCTELLVLRIMAVYF